MQRLVDSKLFGADLVEVSLPQLVSRYNDCLVRLGIAPTALERFSIDGMGWSPEIAYEKANGFYLSAGEANPMAVVLVPEQRDKPVYLPYNSYDRAMLKQFFTAFQNEIIDITISSAIGLDIDQELTRYRSPRDLLLVNYVIVRSTCGEAAENVAQQKSLVNKFLSEGAAWFDRSLRQEIIESAKRSGDLRYRRVEIPDMKFNDVGTFHTKAFGGVFVLRCLRSKTGILVLQERPADPTVDLSSNIFQLAEERLIDRLLAEEVVKFEFKGSQEDLAFLQNKKDCLAAQAIFWAQPEVDVISMSPAQRKQKLSSLGGRIPPVYLELEHAAKLVSQGFTPTVKGTSSELLLLMLRPHERLSAFEREVVWKLLTLLAPIDVVQLYRFDKELFFKMYKEWPETQKQWACDILARRKRLKISEIYG